MILPIIATEEKRCSGKRRGGRLPLHSLKYCSLMFITSGLHGISFLHTLQMCNLNMLGPLEITGEKFNESSEMRGSRSSRLLVRC